MTTSGATTTTTYVGDIEQVATTGGTTTTVYVDAVGHSAFEQSSSAG